MCGICGEITFDGAPVRTDTLGAMRDRLVHRGPDDSGVFVSPSGRGGLGFRRLAIIDLSHEASQPLANEDDTVWVAFNGEIYNFRELRQDLLARGHTFRTHGDTETLVHLYEERGAGFVDVVDGMFAIAIWDEARRRLVLARDRAGKKPLFYYRDDRRLVFGSEIKALFAHPDVPAEIDRSEVPSYFQYGYVPHPRTIYRRVRQVNPASVLTIDQDGSIQEREYWRMRLPSTALNVPYAEAREQVRDLVTQSVRRRLMSDVPLGAFLSAGIDSTIVVGVMSGLMNQPVKTFTIGFDDNPAFDETAGARLVAERFRTEHHEFRVKPSAVDLIDRLIWHHDGPFGDSSAIPTYLLSELTRTHVTVALTGDGGDELFAGYLRFRAALAAEKLPAIAGRVLTAALRMLPHAAHERHFLSRARRFARFVHLPLVERAARWRSVFPDGLDALLQPDVIAAVAPRSASAGPPRVHDAPTSLGQLLAANFESYLPDDLLVKTDRCTMANSLEARSPFLDTALIEYTASLPDAYKLARGRTKAILRDAFADLLPADIDRRPKTGFGVPLDRWFRAELRDYARDTLLAPSARLRDYVRQDRVGALVDDHLAGRTNAGHRLWTLVTFERWLQMLPSWTLPATSVLGTMTGPS